jgi:hypothetical protein
VGITTEATEITENNGLSGSVYSVCSVVDFKLSQYLPAARRWPSTVARRLLRRGQCNESLPAVCWTST